jgi:hypothetical protein
LYTDRLIVLLDAKPLAQQFAEFSLANYQPSSLDQNHFVFDDPVPEKISLSIQDLYNAGIPFATATATTFFNVQ